MNGKQIIVLSIFPACPTRVSAEWSWVGDMTRTKCEIEQLGGNKSALTTKSDQHVAAAGSSPFRICPKAVYTKWGIFISLLLHLILLSNIILKSPDGKSRSPILLLLSLLVCDIETIMEGNAMWSAGLTKKAKNTFSELLRVEEIGLLFGFLSRSNAATFNQPTKPIKRYKSMHQYW